MREQRLDEVPSLGSLYSRALAATARTTMSRGAARDRLPEVAYVADGLRADAATLSAYQELLGEPGTDELPAGYVHVLVFPLAMALMVRPDFPLPVLGMVHIANRVEQHRPVLLGEELTARAQAGDARAHRKGTLVDLTVTVGAGGQTVWEGTSTYLARGTRLPSAITDSAPASLEERAEDGAGDVVALWSLGADTGKRYAEVSGDRNPIHVSRVGAKVFGFPRPIAHGMYTASRALAQVARFRGDAFTWDVEFAKPVLLPGRVALSVDTAGEGVRYTGRHPRSGKLHFSGSVTPRA
ncbi:MaoC/PaaZ C-terminal domain-containing protein [Georgenia sp. H159]|uniref:MaoC/PaaZ C-terminal domain-containing protein n=1 Tax=Georgenia sp. H159 TaxID=3076115 RepID=UPI002D797517|nr:MaoC/PaaZ C-terminal domain-containing protein [Georgenia sp. H159]